MKKLKLFLGVFLSVVFVLVVSNAFAQKDKKPQMKCEQHFAAMDTDKDGKLSLSEFKAMKHPGNAEELFKERDANKDGFLTKEECYAKGMNPEKCMGKGKGDHKEKFAEMDTDKDGKVTLKEFTAVKHHRDNPEEVFKSKDANKDGFLTMDEFCAGHMEHGKGMGKHK